MITDNVYTLYQTVDSKEDLEKFINEGTPIISNFENWREMIGYLIDHKEQTKRNYTKKRASGSTYRNVYAHYLKIIIPYEVKKEDWKDFITVYMETVDARYKKLLWICKYFTVNKANYAEIICFTRYVYSKPKKQNVAYTRDYYYNSETGKLCSPNHPKAVLKAKEGDLKRKENGSPVTVMIYVKQIEERMFKFRNFIKFTQKLKCKYLKARKKFCPTSKTFRRISRITIKNDESMTIRKAKMFKNTKICEVNDILIEYQKSIINGKFYIIDDIYKKFHQLLLDVDQMIHGTKIEFKKINNYLKNWWIENISNEFI